MRLQPKDFCRALMLADTASEVKDLLEQAGYWSDSAAWRPVGDNENNRAIVGNQQEDAVSALVEKLTNSVDAVLINRVLEEGIDPAGMDAPKTMRDAVALFVGEGVTLGAGGRWWNRDSLTREQQDSLAKHIWVSVTGSRQLPSVTVADRGEGQTPDDFPRTFMALVGHKAADGRLASQKKDIPFVQGQYNMGSSGVYPYCSDGFQLLISRRNPRLLSDSREMRDSQWGFTVVRKNRDGLSKGSVFEYLAPVGEHAPRGVLAFEAASMPLLPESPPTSVPNHVYSTEVEHGTLVKLYEYNFKATGVSSSHIFRRGGLLSQVELALPQSGLPLRFVEGRDFKGKPGSFQTNLFGILYRLDRLEGGLEDDLPEVADGASEQVEQAAGLQLEGPPVNGELMLRGTRIPWTAFVFREDAKDRTGNGRYALIFHINGQKHGHEPKGWFRGKQVGLSYLGQKNTILVLVDCSALSFGQREDIFKPSRDRIAKTDISQELYGLLTDSLRTSPELQELQNKQHQRMTAERLSDNAPVTRVLERLLKSTPMLARFFKLGSELKLSKPFPDAGMGDGSGASKFEGKRHPSFLKLRGGVTARGQTAHLGSRARVQFSTDAEDGYFDRAIDPGVLEVRYLERPEDVSGSRGALRDGAFSYSVVLPGSAAVGDQVELEFRIVDDAVVAPLACTVSLTVEAEAKPPSGPAGRPRGTGVVPPGAAGGPKSLDSLDIRRCSKSGRDETDMWLPSWTERTAVTIEDNPETGGITYFVNVDNIFLQDYQKQMPGKDPALIEARFMWSLVLLSLSIIEYHSRKEVENSGQASETEEKDEMSAADRRDQQVARTTEAMAQLILPTMDAVGTMTSELFEEEEE